ncbi:hypothetical protein [Neobacillus sp. YIM B06451]|uniref:hypothetical protein n=1 Tax=Neobacillus sp. YIM B06451 TaxID=3070994 RepID=UPI00292CB3F2|nr:hypothetical protein [Neobacillus sp. YIM B06451]
MDKQRNAPKPTLYITQPEVSKGPPMQDHFIWRKKKEVPKAQTFSELMDEKEVETIENPVENRLDPSGDATIGTEPIGDSHFKETGAPEAVGESLVEDTGTPNAVDDGHFEDKGTLRAVGIINETPTDSDSASPAALEADAVPTTSEDDPGEEQPISDAGTHEQAANQRKPEKQSALVQYFLQQMKDREIQRAEPVSTAFGKPEDSPEGPAERPKPNEYTKKIRRMVTTLARYPKFLEPPQVNAVVNGKPLTFQIDSKRGDKIRVKIGNELRIIKIDDISEMKIQ